MRDPATAECWGCGRSGDPHLAICQKCSDCCPGMQLAREQAETLHTGAPGNNIDTLAARPRDDP